MKYFAILKDSLREARDSWVLLGLVVLSTMVILFVASLSFKPLSADRTMRLFFSQHPAELPPIFEAMNKRRAERVWLIRFAWQPTHLEKIVLLRGEPDSPHSDYELTVSSSPRHRGDPAMAAPEPNDVRPDKKKHAVDRRAEMAYLRLLFEDAEAVGYIKVESIEPIGKDDEDRGSQKYRIIVHGTPTTHRIWATETSLFFGYAPLDWILSDAPLSYRIYKVAKFFISFGSWIAVLLGIVVTAFFMPNMLRKGTIDMLLVKPISRWALLTYKYLGGLTFIFLITGYAIGGIWLALGIRSGLWANGALLLIFSLTFFFAILYAISTLVGVVTRSVIMSILVTIVAYAGLAILGVAHGVADDFEKMQKGARNMKEMRGDDPMPEKDVPDWVYPIVTTIQVAYAVSPRTEDLNDINDLIVYTEFMTGSLADIRKLDTSERSWWLSLLIAAAWIGIFLGMAILWFTYKDY